MDGQKKIARQAGRLKLVKLKVALNSENNHIVNHTTSTLLFRNQIAVTDRHPHSYVNRETDGPVQTNSMSLTDRQTLLERMRQTESYLPSNFHSTHCPVLNLYSNRSFLLVRLQLEWMSPVYPPAQFKPIHAFIHQPCK